MDMDRTTEAIRKAILAERAGVIAYLRRRADLDEYPRAAAPRTLLETIADDIDRGDHLHAHINGPRPNVVWGD